MRLPMKPSHTPATTPTFLMVRASFIAVASTSFAVFAPRTTSSSFITLAGLKKCRPITSCGRDVTAAISFDVERGGVGGEDRARLAPPCRACANTSFLTAMSSNTASMTMSTSLSVVVARARPVSRPMRLSIGLLGEPALGDRGRVVLAHDAEALVERLLASPRAPSPECRRWRSSSRCRRPWCRRRSPRPT